MAEKKPSRRKTLGGKRKLVEIPPINVKMFKLRIIGDTPLMCKNFGAKAREVIRNKQTGVATQARAARKPEDEFRESLYPIDGNGTFGFPGSGLKKCAVRASEYVGLKMTFTRGAFYVIGDLLPIKGSKPRMREDVGRLKGQTGTLIYRGEFEEWAIEVPIRYNANVMTEAQIVNLYNNAGFSVGIGEWRPEKGGSKGMFHVG